MKSHRHGVRWWVGLIPTILGALAFLLMPLLVFGQPEPKVVLSSPKAAETTTVPMKRSTAATPKLVIVRPPNTNTYSLALACDPIDALATNVTVWCANLAGAVTSTNFGVTTNFLVRGFSVTNRYSLAASVQDTAGNDSGPSNVLPWPPPLNWFLTLSTLPPGPSLCLTNPTGFQCFRTRVSGTNGAFESESSLAGPWAQIGGVFSTPSNQVYRVKIGLSNDWAAVLASEIK